MDENLVVGKLTKTRAVLPKSKYHLSSAGMKHSTPTFQSKTWSIRLDNSTGSVEHLRDATLMGRDKTTELSLEQLIHLRAGNSTSKILQSSAVKLQPIQETAVSDSLVEISGTKGESVQNSERRAGVDNLTQNVTENVTQPKIDLTHHAESDLEEALSRKVAEIEYMSQLLQEKDEMIDNLQDNMEECQAGLDELRKIEEANKEILEKAREDEDKLVEVNNQLLEASNRIKDYEAKLLETADQSLREELKSLRAEKEDLIRGMENLHGIIETSQTSLDDKKKDVLRLQQELQYLKENIQSIDKLREQLRIKDEQISSLEREIQDAKEQHLEGRSVENSSLEKMIQEKQLVESQLERVTLEMARVQSVVAEMTKSFKHQIQIKEQEVRKCQEQNQSLANLSQQLQHKCQELEAEAKINKEKLDSLEKSSSEIRSSEDIELDNNLGTGSLDELSNMVQAELDLSTELDNTLLSQMMSQVASLDNTALSATNSTGMFEIQRLIKKIQGDGIQVLSLSERLFLMQHTNVGKSFSLTSDTEPDGSKERELGRRLEVLEFQLKQRVSASRCPSRRRICWRV